MPERGNSAGAVRPDPQPAAPGQPAGRSPHSAAASGDTLYPGPFPGVGFAPADAEPTTRPQTSDAASADPTADPTPGPTPGPSHWAPPTGRPVTGRRRRGGWLPGAAVVLSCVLVFLASAVLLREPGPVFDTYLPADGATSTVAFADGSAGQLEQAVLARSEINGHGLLAGVIEFNQRSSAELRRTTWLRGTLTPATAPTVVMLSVLDDTLALEAISTADLGLAFLPGIPLARADGGDVAPGRQVTAVTTDQRTETFAATRVTGTEGDCRTVEVTLATAPRPIGRATLTVEVCTGRGLASLSVTSPAASFGFGAGAGSVVAAQPPYEGALSGPDQQWREVARWQSSQASIEQAGGFGVEPVAGQPAGTPLVRPDGGLVIYDTQPNDLLALGPPSGTPERRRLLWRAHPGGQIGQTLGLGDLAVVATSAKRVAAYDGAGLRRWVVELPDVVVGSMVAAGNGERLLFNTRDGRAYAVDPRSGAVVWDVSVSTDISGGLRVAGNRVLVLDGPGVAHVLDLQTGRELWQGEQMLDLSVYAFDEQHVYVQSRSTLYAFDAAGGTRSWTAHVEGVPEAAATDGTQLVVATRDEVVAFDPATGSRRWRSVEGGEFVLIDGPALLTGSGQQVRALSTSDGAALGSWPLPRDATTANRCLCAPDGGGVVFTVPAGVLTLR